MSWFDPPAGEGPSTPRVLAVGGAVAITAMALAGSLGFGPGAQSSAPTHGASAQSAPAADPGTADNGSGSSSTSGSDSWLTVEGGSANSGTSSSSDPGGTPDQSKGTAPPSTGSGSSNGSGTSSNSGSPDHPALPADSGTGRRVVYDISAQRVWLVDDEGRVERTYLVSGARKESLLPPKTYQVTSRDRDAVSFNNKETMHYMVRFASGHHSAIGFHDIPARPDGSLVQTRADLGTPLSAGCIRQWEPDAKAMWRFASVDTPVIVVA